MVSSNATEVTISFFLRTLREHNPGVIPAKIMSDFDKAQINGIRLIYFESQIYLCWWHVLHAWQQHIAIHSFPDLWKLLKEWIRLTGVAKFDEHWAKIQQLAPPSFIEYIRTYWLPVRAMWSARERVGRTIFEYSETNMLIEA